MRLENKSTWTKETKPDCSDISWSNVTGECALLSAFALEVFWGSEGDSANTNTASCVPLPSHHSHHLHHLPLRLRWDQIVACWQVPHVKNSVSSHHFSCHMWGPWLIDNTAGRNTTIGHWNGRFSPGSVFLNVQNSLHLQYSGCSEDMRHEDSEYWH